MGAASSLAREAAEIATAVNKSKAANKILDKTKDIIMRWMQNVANFFYLPREKVYIPCKV